MRMTTSILLSLVALTSVAQADAPLEPPRRHSKCSPSGEYCVTSDPIEGTFGHEAEAEAGAPALVSWGIEGWLRIFWVLDDGEHLIAGYNGLNLVPQNDPTSETILSFWRQGELLRAYTLADLGYKRGDLRRTVSHYHWGSYRGLNASGTFELSMVDGRTIVFEPTTGEVAERSRPAV
jgi:hypothetical protein